MNLFVIFVIEHTRSKGLIEVETSLRNSRLISRSMFRDTVKIQDYKNIDSNY